jgi:hypothetical protein
MAKKKSATRTRKAKRPAEARESKPLGTVYQIKITLLGSKPPIWRRIQVSDCTLDKLHEYIQTSMGWTNSHLHQFRLGEQLFGDPELMQENFEEFDFKDSTKALLSDIVPERDEPFRFRYEYDFGDSWEHEILVEDSSEAEAGHKHPTCLEGKRACPPEDCGGVWGYPELLDAIGNKKHKQHDELLEWVGDDFDPEEFDADEATKMMKEGLPSWRDVL